MEYEKIIKKLKETRESKNLSYEDVGNAIGRPFLTIFCIENGRKQLSVVDFLKICKFLEISPLDFLDEN